MKKRERRSWFWCFAFETWSELEDDSDEHARQLNLFLVAGRFDGCSLNILFVSAFSTEQESQLGQVVPSEGSLWLVAFRFRSKQEKGKFCRSTSSRAQVGHFRRASEQALGPRRLKCQHQWRNQPMSGLDRLANPLKWPIRLVCYHAASRWANLDSARASTRHMNTEHETLSRTSLLNIKSKVLNWN